MHRVLRRTVMAAVTVAVAAIGLPAAPAVAAPPPLPVVAASSPAIQMFPNRPDGSGSAQSLAVVRTIDDRLFYSRGYSFSTTDWQTLGVGWHEVPGGGRTRFSPTLRYYPATGNIVLAAVGLNGAGIWIQNFNPTTMTWQSSWAVIPTGGVFIDQPELVPVVNALDVYGITGDRRIWRQRYDPAANSWLAAWVQVPGPGVPSASRPTAAWSATGGTLGHTVMVVSGNNGHLYTSTGPETGTGPSWGPWTEIPGSGLTVLQPTVTVYQRGFSTTVILMVRGANDGLAYQTRIDGVWAPGWKYLTFPGSTGWSPALSNVTGAGKYRTQVAVLETNYAVAWQTLEPSIDGRTLDPADGTTYKPGWWRVPGSLV